MLMHQLAADAERILGELPPPMYDCKRVRWLVSLDVNGCLQGIVPLGMDEKGKHRGLLMEVPFVKRTSGIRPILLADTPAYTYGPPSSDKRAEAKHEAYLGLMRECAAATGNAEMSAVLNYLCSVGEEEGLPVSAGTGDIVTFEVAGARPIEDSAVKKFWRTKAGDSAGDSPTSRSCIICGSEAPIPEMPPVPVKGVPGSQSEMSLTGVNFVTGESYGLVRAENASICHICGERAGKTLNFLLRDSAHHVRVGPVAYVFWTKEDSPFDIATLMSAPREGDVRALLESAKAGRKSAEVQHDGFFAAALSANGGRVVVRKWISTTVPQVAANLARWFRLTGIVRPWGEDSAPLSTKGLAASIFLKPEDVTARVSTALMSAALDGGDPPFDLLRAALARCRVSTQRGGRVTHPQAALIKAVLVRRCNEQEEYMTTLECQEESPAYLCGRLFAVIESVQYAALGRVNATVADKFFSAASTAPATVFGKLLSDAQPHLAKLRKTREGAHVALQTRLEEIATRIGPSFPRILSIEEQGRFMLGYYHQRATDRADSRVARERKNGASDSEKEESK
ncbi:MAG: type I-C CRISPR-associated protein Cas8c/Csd1 [Aeromicrobium sp.]|nr:type I-C CRISPR-associated protein Cas8c/Csd1 [Aeromicrobium sp.]